MIKALLIIRLRQLFRIAKGLGLIRFMFLSGLILFFAFGIFILSGKAPNSFYVSISFLLMIVVIHIKRQDKQFLKIHLRNFKLVLGIEYFLLILPAFVCLMYHFQWIPATLLLLLSLSVLFIDFLPRRHSLNTSVQRLIPSECFEWKAGIRKTLVYILPLWILGITSSFFIGSVPVVIFFLGLIFWSFYENAEPLQMVLVFEKNTCRFLSSKIRFQTILFTLIILPLILSFILFHPGLWYIPVAEYLLIVTVNIYIILAKYAFYQPNERSHATQFFIAIGALGLIIPLIIPVVWILSIRFYFRSRENLNLYLNDYN